jgi:hypothetical protein
VTIRDADRLGREDLVEALLEFNNCSTFWFTREWLEQQQTERLRSLLREKVVLAQGLIPLYDDLDDTGGAPQQGAETSG